MKKVGLLSHHTYLVSQGFLGQIAEVAGIECDPAFGGVVQARQKISDRRLAGAAGTYQGYELTRLHVEGHVLERPPATGGRAKRFLWITTISVLSREKRLVRISLG